MESYDYSLHYSRFHDDTEEHAEGMAAYLAGMLSPHLPQDRTIRILDVGCGYGFALRALRKLGYQNIAGLEISQQQAERSRRAGFEVTVSDDSEAYLHSHANEFTVVLLMDVLEHIPVGGQIRFAGAVYDALQPGGKVLLTVPNASSPIAGVRRYIDFTHHSAFTDHSLHFVLVNAGFHSVFIEPSAPLGRPPIRLWKRSARAAMRRWIVRWWWRQVFLSEAPWENVDFMSFEPNLFCVATKA
jgi:SAM-dependent methyltransferase